MDILHVNLLKQGKAAWNPWRKHHRDIQPDLQGADLSQTNLRGTDLRGANLNQANLSQANCVVIDLIGV